MKLFCNDMNLMLQNSCVRSTGRQRWWHDTALSDSKCTASCSLTQNDSNWLCIAVKTALSSLNQFAMSILERIHGGHGGNVRESADV
jgi:hypothetical protein